MTKNKYALSIIIAILLIAVLAIALSNIKPSGNSSTTSISIETTTIPANLYQPPPPVGISVNASQEITWYYNNATKSIFIVGVAPSNSTTGCNIFLPENCSIGVTKGQVITFAGYAATQGAAFTSNAIMINNETYEISDTGNIQINFIVLPPD